MAKKADLTDVSTGYQSNATMNDNFTALNDQFDNTLSLDGSTPNSMGADLDMDSNDILNVGTVNTDTLKVGGVTLVSASATPDWRGAWVTATAYALDDLVQESGSTYICVEAHTSGTFATDLTAVKWELFAQKGSAGAGTGDMLAANNLSDVADAATARSNLGLGTAATTAAAAYATAAQGTLADSAVQPTDTDASTLDWVLDEDDMASDSATKVPTQQSVKAYVDDNIGGWSADQGSTLSADADNITITGLSAYNELDCRLAMSTTDVGTFYLQARVSAGTWRTLWTATQGGSNDSHIIGQFKIYNFNGSEGSTVPHFAIGLMDFTLNEGMIDNTANENTRTDLDTFCSVCFRDETWDEIRIYRDTNNFKGTASSRYSGFYVKGR